VSSKKKRRAGRLLNELIAWSGADWLAAKIAEKDMTKALQNAAAPARRRLVIVGGSVGTTSPHCDAVSKSNAAAERDKLCTATNH